MPHHPSEGETESSVLNKVANGNPDSNSSNHPLYNENKQPVKATAADHKSKGPVIPESELTPDVSVLLTWKPNVIPEMPEAESKEDLKARAREMNK